MSFVFSRGHLDVCQGSKGMKASGSLGNGGKEESCAAGFPGDHWRRGVRWRAEGGDETEIFQRIFEDAKVVVQEGTTPPAYVNKPTR